MSWSETCYHCKEAFGFWDGLWAKTIEVEIGEYKPIQTKVLVHRSCDSRVREAMNEAGRIANQMMKKHA